MDCIFNKEWWKAAGTRAIKTVAQAAIGYIGAGALVLSDVNWVACASAAALAGFLSLLNSMAGLPEVCEDPQGLHVKED